MDIYIGCKLGIPKINAIGQKRRLLKQIGQSSYGVPSGEIKIKGHSNGVALKEFKLS